jgi:dipeptidyl aminopeptidase/acylaminoacyl peptidase
MKRFALLFFISNPVLLCYSQLQFKTKQITEAKSNSNPKPVIDFEAIDHWPTIGNTTIKQVDISDNGKYFAYEIIHPPFYTNTLVVQSTNGREKQEFEMATPGSFANDSRHYIFNISDSLCILSLDDMKPIYKVDVASWKQSKNNTGNWLAYLKNTSAELVVRNLRTGQEKQYFSVIDYSFADSGEWLAFRLNNKSSDLMLVNLKSNDVRCYKSVKNYSFESGGTKLLLELNWNIEGASITRLLWSDLKTGDIRNVYTGNNVKVSGYSVDASGKQLAFLVQEDNKPFLKSIWYYKVGLTNAVKKVDSRSPGISSGLEIVGKPTFTSNNNYVLFSVREIQNVPDKTSEFPMVDVWSYRDTILQATQLSHLSGSPMTYEAVVDPANGKIIQLSNSYVKYKGLSGDYALIQRDAAGDRFWEKNYKKDSIWLVFLKDGSKTYLNTRSSFLRFSPEGKYLIYFDEERTGNYFSYELATGKLVNITTSVPVYLGDEYEYYEPSKSLTNHRTGIAGWLGHDKAVLIYDNYDIWQIDLSGNSAPENLTNEYGRLNKIKLRLTRGNNKETLNTDDTLLITGFDTRTKYNGFFAKSLKKKGDPTVLCMGPYSIDQNENGFLPINANNFNIEMFPVKATQAKVWIVKRESIDEAPNFYLTNDFKTFQQLTDLKPHQVYNWLRNELISFKQSDGKESQGILYKPEDFDPSKKYPVIFNYYEQFSHRLFQYPATDYTESGFINIPWFVSHGYLVFTPDIQFTIGKSPISALNCVVGAAQHLAELPYVDRTRMGISGHSMAGGFTNYIVTHTNIFAAVFEGAGASNAISSAFQLSGEPTDNTSRLLDRDERGKGSLWENPGEWLAQSPIMNADKVTSPLLIFHCKDDWAMPWAQAVEMFVALRRLDKRAWLLQYDAEGHNLNKYDNRKDLTIRLTEYFDHYLKGAPPPKWMTRGIPARMKGIETRYELDPEGSCGMDCRICKEKNYDLNALSKKQTW